jgi:hypothetical protein
VVLRVVWGERLLSRCKRVTTDEDAPDRAPEEIARQARDDALAGLEDAAGFENTADRAPAEQQVATEFARSLAEALAGGLGVSHMKHQCSVIADEARFYNKTELIEHVEEELESIKATHGNRPFDELIADELEEVTVVRTSDAKQSTLYRWRFQTCYLETRGSADGRTHFAWTQFRDMYFDATGDDPARPTKEHRGGEEWREFIVGIIDERGRNVTTRGPRTAALDSLENFIRQARAFGTIEDMVDYDGVYLDENPDDEETPEPSELWIPNEDIMRICKDQEITPRALQVELQARGHTVDRINGVSESTFVNYHKFTYWVLSAEIADVGYYEAEPTDPAEQVRAEQAEEEAAKETSDADTAGEDSDEGDATSENESTDRDRSDSEGTTPHLERFDDGDESDDDGTGMIGSLGRDPDASDTSDDDDNGEDSTGSSSTGGDGRGS